MMSIVRESFFMRCRANEVCLKILRAFPHSPVIFKRVISFAHASLSIAESTRWMGLLEVNSYDSLFPTFMSADVANRFRLQVQSAFDFFAMIRRMFFPITPTLFEIAKISLVASMSRFLEIALRTTSLLESVIFSRRDFFEEEFTEIIRHPERYPLDDFLRLVFVLFDNTQIPERAIPALLLHFLGDVEYLNAESTIRRESFFFMLSCIPMQDMMPRDEDAIWTPSLADFLAGE
jgi:hypothetical protein